MAEKATLLSKLPPVAKSKVTQSSADSSTLSSQNLQQDSAQANAGQVAGVKAAEVVVPAGEVTITGFQVAIYASFVLSFCLAGFAAVLLWRKSMKLLEARFMASVRALSVSFALAGLLTFFATFLYTNYLKNDGASLPLVMTMVSWIVLGAAIAVALNYLLTPQKKPSQAGVIVDVSLYVGIFSLALLAVSGSVTANAATVFALLSCFLFIVPIARSFTTYRTAKARHPELCETSDTVLIFTLLFLPALLPVLAFLKVVGMGAELTQLLFNFVTIDFLLVAGLAMLASADVVDASSSADGEASSESQGSQATAKAAKAAPVAEPVQESKPVVEFASASSAKRPLSPKKLPPRKPQSLPTAPKKPVSRGQDSAAKSPSGLKAPAKPKKRF